MIGHIPAWTNFDPNDRGAAQDIIRGLNELAHEEIPVLRKAVSEFVLAHRKANTYSVAQMSRIFLLNRYIFAVPSESNRNEVHLFGGWIGVPHDEQKTNCLWPFALANKGDLELIGKYRGYNGEQFQALEEFDDFAERFGRR